MTAAFLCADPNILNAIYNSEALNDVFISNFQKDPTLTWQYFGSSTGFFRIYPGQFAAREDELAAPPRTKAARFSIQSTTRFGKNV